MCILTNRAFETLGHPPSESQKEQKSVALRACRATDFTAEIRNNGKRVPLMNFRMPDSNNPRHPGYSESRK